MALKCTSDTGNYFTYNNHGSLLGVFCALKNLSVCLQPLITKEMIFLRLEHQERTEVNDQLKSCESEVMTCKQNSQQKML